jgi:steroid 5-alpha reductase family enzyme
MITVLFAILVAMTAIMATGWVVQRAAGDGGWTDVFWTYGTGAVLAIAALAPIGAAAAPTWRQAMVAALIVLWSVRLGTYVALRVARGPEDARYAGLRKEWGDRFQKNMLPLMLVQGPASTILAISVLMAARNPAPGLRIADIAGVAIMLVAIVGEAVADQQMKQFKRDPAHRGQICDTGLWAWSRHPNYFFEFLGWLAYPAIALDLAHPVTWLSFIAPAAMFAILRYLTGVPPLEAAMLRSRGDAYRRYQARVSPFLPRPPHPPAPGSQAA